jgi:hypothetical protein
MAVYMRFIPELELRDLLRRRLELELSGKVKKEINKG